MPTLAPAVAADPSLEPDLERLASAFRALADPARLRILRRLARRPQDGVCACDLEGVTGLSQPTVSHHMKCLVSAGLVSSEKRGRWMHYRLDPDGLGTVRAALAALAGPKP